MICYSHYFLPSATCKKDMAAGKYRGVRSIAFNGYLPILTINSMMINQACRLGLSLPHGACFRHLQAVFFREQKKDMDTMAIALSVPLSSAKRSKLDHC